MEILPVATAKHLVAWRHVGAGDTLVVSFCGIGRDQGQGDLQPVFPKVASDSGKRHVLFVGDPARSWLSAPGVVDELVALIRDTAQDCGAKRIIAVGHSLGGYMAAMAPALLAGVLHIDAALCLSPQSSGDPVVSQDGRWAQWRDGLVGKTRDFGPAEVMPETQYVVLFGVDGAEAGQAKGFDPSDALSLFLLPGMGHDDVVEELVLGGHATELLAHMMDTPAEVAGFLHERLGAQPVTSAERRDEILARAPVLPRSKRNA